MQKNWQKHSGFTLLEVMIACMLGMVLCGVIMQNYLSNKNIYNLNTKIARLNENLQLADFFLRQAVLHAGFAGCRNISELKIHNHTNVDFKLNLTHPIFSYSNTDKNSDILLITKVNTAITNINQDYIRQNYINLDDKEKNSIAVTQNPAIESNMILLISDCQHADLFATDNYIKTQAIDLHDVFSHDYSKQSTVVSRFEVMKFFIAPSAHSHTKNKPIYNLYVSINNGRKNKLIPEITHMQIHYEINNNMAQDLTTEQMHSANLWDQITAVKIILTPQEQLLGIKKWRIYIKLQQTR